MSTGTLASAVSTDKPKKLLDRVRDALRVKHYSLRTEQAYTNCPVSSILAAKKRDSASSRTRSRKSGVDLRNIGNVSHKSKAGHRAGPLAAEIG